MIRNWKVTNHEVPNLFLFSLVVYLLYYNAKLFALVLKLDVQRMEGRPQCKHGLYSTHMLIAICFPLLSLYGTFNN